MPTAQAPRANREQETRTATARPAWKPLDQYPLPKVDGLRFRWIRTILGDVPDTRNVSRRFREGWVPVRAADYPELQMRSDASSQWPEGIEVSGLLLCQLPSQIVDARNTYHRNMAEQQMTAVDNSMFRENVPGDHGMRIQAPTRRTRVTTGRRAEVDPAAEE